MIAGVAHGVEAVDSEGFGGSGFDEFSEGHA